MATRVGFFFTFCVILGVMNGFVGSVRVFRVGDELGWQDLGVNNTAVYGLWPTEHRFRVGDSLLFEYKNDSVIQVDKWGYYHCNTSNPIIAFNSGNTEFKLDKPGPFFFVSGEPNHCGNGQKLFVQVMHHHHHHSRPPFIAMAPNRGQTYLAPSPNPNSGFVVAATKSYVCVAATFVALIFGFIY